MMLRKSLRHYKKLDPQPVAQFVKTANQFRSEVSLEQSGHKVNGKSMMSVMELANRRGGELIIEVEGEDAPRAMEVLSNLLKPDSVSGSEE